MPVSHAMGLAASILPDACGRNSSMRIAGFATPIMTPSEPALIGVYWSLIASNGQGCAAGQTPTPAGLRSVIARWQDSSMPREPATQAISDMASAALVQAVD